MKQVCDAVNEIHSLKIIHRDIKPSNVLVSLESGSPKPKIIDFGISKLRDEDDHKCEGTVNYMAPEFLDVTSTRTS